MKISIIVPVLNEASVIQQCLEKLWKLENDFEVIVADGGSKDETVEIAKKFKLGNIHRLVILENIQAGRAHQMNAGADASQGEVLLFLHADCELERGALKVISDRLQDEQIIGGGFYKKYSKENLFLMIYRVAMNLIRTKWLKNLVGTNAIFIRRERFFQLGKYPEVTLLEDVILSDRLKRAGKLVFLKPHVISSSRRYYRGGILKRIWIAYKIMYLFRLRRRSPDELGHVYQQLTRKKFL